MYQTAALVAVLGLSSVALAEEGGSVPVPVRGQIAVGKTLTPVQKIAALEDALNKETDLRVGLGEKASNLTAENAKLLSALENTGRDKAALDNELVKTRDVLVRAQRDYDSLRAGYITISKIISVSLPIIVFLILTVLFLIGWLLRITRHLATRVHDVPTIAKILEYEGQAGHLREQINIDKSHIAALKERLANLGIED